MCGSSRTWYNRFVAIPDVDIPIRPVLIPWEYVMKAERAVEKVEERLRRTVAALNRRNVSYAVVGGNAVAVWVATKDEGAIRNTKDVDVLLDRSDLPSTIAAMRDAGFEHAEVHGVSMFMDQDDPMPSRGVHLVFAGERSYGYGLFVVDAASGRIRALVSSIRPRNPEWSPSLWAVEEETLRPEGF